MKAKPVILGVYLLALATTNCGSTCQSSPDDSAEGLVADVRETVNEVVDVETIEGEVSLDVLIPTPTLSLSRCKSDFESCVDVDTLSTPYLRHEAWLEAHVEGGPADEPVAITLLIGGESRFCLQEDAKPGSCRVAFQTIWLPETVAVTLVATYGGGHPTRLEKTWQLPIFDCEPPEGRSICLEGGSWAAQPDVPLEPSAGCDYGCFEAAIDEDGRISALAAESGVSAGDSCRVSLARLDAGVWSKKVLQEGPTTNCRSPLMGLVASRGAAWITDVLDVPGEESDNAWHTLSIAEVTDAGISFDVIDLCMICPSEFTCPRGGWVNPVVRVGPDGTKHVFLTTSSFPGLYLVNSGEGWRCEMIRAPSVSAVGVLGLPVESSNRMELGPGGLVHLAFVPQSFERVAYKAGMFGAWADLMFAAGIAPQLELGIADDGSAHYVVVQSDATVTRYRIDDGVVLSQTDLTPQAIVSCKDDPECHVTPEQSGISHEYHVYPGDVELLTDSCGRDHLLIPAANVEAVYLTNLHGAWTGEPVPEFGSNKVGYQPGKPVRMFQTPNGDMHVLYIENYPTPRPSHARIRHWVRKCTETLAE